MSIKEFDIENGTEFKDFKGKNIYVVDESENTAKMGEIFTSCGNNPGNYQSTLCQRNKELYLPEGVDKCPLIQRDLKSLHWDYGITDTRNSIYKCDSEDYSLYKIDNYLGFKNLIPIGSTNTDCIDNKRDKIDEKERTCNNILNNDNYCTKEYLRETADKINKYCNPITEKIDRFNRDNVYTYNINPDELEKFHSNNPEYIFTSNDLDVTDNNSNVKVTTTIKDWRSDKYCTLWNSKIDHLSDGNKYNYRDINVDPQREEIIDTSTDEGALKWLDIDEKCSGTYPGGTGNKNIFENILSKTCSKICNQPEIIHNYESEVSWNSTTSKQDKTIKNTPLNCEMFSGKITQTNPDSNCSTMGVNACDKKLDVTCNLFPHRATHLVKNNTSSDRYDISSYSLDQTIHKGDTECLLNKQTTTCSDRIYIKSD
jgi:hypothetical protein